MPETWETWFQPGVTLPREGAPLQCIHGKPKIIGMVLVIGQWIGAAQSHRRVRYALSTQAAYVATSWNRRKLESCPILRSTATGLEKCRHADTVWFHIRAEKVSDGDTNTTRVGFDNIAEGEKVYHLIRSIQTGTA